MSADLKEISANFSTFIYVHALKSCDFSSHADNAFNGFGICIKSCRPITNFMDGVDLVAIDHITEKSQLWAR